MLPPILVLHELYGSNRRPTVFRAIRIPEPYDALLLIATRPFVDW